MRTQKHDLKDEIKHLEKELQNAILKEDVFEQKAILKDLDIAKSTLINIQIMGTNYSQETAQSIIEQIHI